MKKAIVLAACLALSLTSCKFIDLAGAKGWEVVRGSENIITKTLDLGSFDEVALAMSADVVFGAVSDTPTVTVSAPDNRFDYFDFVNEKGSLKLRYKKEIKAIHNGNVLITLTAPTLRKVAVAGSGDFRTEVPIVVGSFDGAVAGSGDLSLAGLTAGDASFAVAGSGDLRVQNLDANKVSAAVAGSGDMFLAGKAGKADVSVSGSGDIDIRSLAVDELKTSVAGSGDILR